MPTAISSLCTENKFAFDHEIKPVLQYPSQSNSIQASPTVSKPDLQYPSQSNSIQASPTVSKPVLQYPSQSYSTLEYKYSQPLSDLCMDALSRPHHGSDMSVCTLHDTHLFCARYRVAQLLGYGGLVMTFFSTLIRSMRNS